VRGVDQGIGRIAGETTGKSRETTDTKMTGTEIERTDTNRGGSLLNHRRLGRGPLNHRPREGDQEAGHLEGDDLDLQGIEGGGLEVGRLHMKRTR